MLKSTPEVTGEDLLARREAAEDAFRRETSAIRSEAAERASVLEARLKELEAEKLLVNRLTQPVGIGTFTTEEDLL